MSIAQYGLTWDTHRSYVCKGFLNFQQNEEFVDMTIAADGHIVKVHKNLFALASPYIKSMLQLCTTPHPVIFLSNVSVEVLNYILMYVYTGEVFVDADKISSFMRVAKELCLTGLGNVEELKVGLEKSHRECHTDAVKPVNNTTCNLQSKKMADKVLSSHTISNSATDPLLASKQKATTNIEISNIAPHNINFNNSTSNYIDTNNINVSTVNAEQDTILQEINLQEPSNYQFIENKEILSKTHKSESGLYTTADGFQYKLEISNVFNNTETTAISKALDIDNNENVNVQMNIAPFDSVGASLPVVNINEIEIPPNPSRDAQYTVNSRALIPQYSVSNRGSLQLILNRYIYYCHHQSHGGRKRRWRCIDYRRGHCPAFIDTDCDIISVRKNCHVHQFHDDKILKKMKRNKVYTSLNSVIEKINTVKT